MSRQIVSAGMREVQRAGPYTYGGRALSQAFSVAGSHQDLFRELAAEFEPGEVGFRPQGGRELAYISARTAMNRLDRVLGPENWWDDYEIREHSVVCRLTIRLPDGQELTKSDAGGYAGMSDSGDDAKSAMSDAFKRAAVKFGVARYLYGDGIPGFPDYPAPRAGHNPQRPQNGHPAAPPQRPHQRPPAPPRDDQNQFRRPTTGRGLFAWSKALQEKYRIDVVGLVNDFGKSQGLPGRMVDWTENAVERAAFHVADHLAQHADYSGELDAILQAGSPEDDSSIPF